MGISDFIEELNHTDEYIHHIYSKGGCYRFHILLSKMFKGCTPYISGTKNHIITRYKGKFYDVYGEVDCLDGFTKLRDEEKKVIKMNKKTTSFYFFKIIGFFVLKAFKRVT